MQTFLPFPNFEDSVGTLHMNHLGNQRNETFVIMKSIFVPGWGWPNHPLVKMWTGYEEALLAYQEATIHEWRSRGYKDTVWVKTYALYEEYSPLSEEGLPPWFGDPDFHLAHQSNLVRKNRDHYGPIFPGVPDDIPYIYPV